jgi:hypothetical protein
LLLSKKAGKKIINYKRLGLTQLSQMAANG